MPTTKLSSFDGQMPLESFLAKFENCSDYYSWNAKKRICHLKNSLEGQASQILWGLPSEATEADVIRLLSNRWGTESQAERFRAELASRRRKPGESAQAVYNDIRRLLALSFTGETGHILEVIGRDAFLTALDNPALKIRVLDQRPATLDEALQAVVRMEAYGGSSSSETNNLDSSNGAKKVRFVKADGDHTGNTQHNDGQLEKRLKQLEQDLAAQKREVRQLSADAEHWKRRAFDAEQQYNSTTLAYPQPVQNFQSATPLPQINHGEVYQPVWSNEQAYVPPPMFNSSSPLPAAIPPVSSQPAAFQRQPPQNQFQPPSSPSLPRGGFSRRQGNGRRGSSRSDFVDRDTCRLCGQIGYWAYSCPHRASTPAGGQSSFVSGVQETTSSGSETYVDAILMCGTKR